MPQHTANHQHRSPSHKSGRGRGLGVGGEGRRLREGFIKSNKLIYFTADFNLRVVDNNKNEKVTKFLKLTFENG